MATSEQGHIGESVLRVEDDPLLRGLGCFLDDVPESPATVHLGFVRSPHPHAKINGIDASAAKALPGVVDVLTAEHLSGLIKPIQADFEKPGFKITHRHALATDRVRFVGDAVAVVLAETAYVVDDAVELVAVDYEPLPAVADIASALDPNAPTVHDYIDNNIVFEGQQKPMDSTRRLRVPIASWKANLPPRGSQSFRWKRAAAWHRSIAGVVH